MMVIPALVWFRPAVLVLVLPVLLFEAFPGSSFAACTHDPGAAQGAASFIDNPSSLLSGSNGSLIAAEITSAVRDFVAANPQALAGVITLLKSGALSSDQQKAIGTGLGLAASICIRPDPAFAAEIQTQIAGTGSADAKQAYAAVTGNQLTGSLGGGAGGGSSGSVGGSQTTTPPPTGSSALQVFTSNSVSNAPTNQFSGSARTGGASATTTSTTTPTNTTTTIVCIVSVTC